MKIRILPVLGLLFTLAVIPRIVTFANENISDNNQRVLHISAQTIDKNKTAITQPSKPTKIIPHCVDGEVLAQINKKMDILHHREKEIKKREIAYKAIEARLDKQMRVIKIAKASLKDEVNNRQSLANKDIVYLTQMYQSMKPKQAAKIFNEMDVNFAAGILREIKSSQAGLILSNMSSRKAYRISILIASKNSRYRQSQEQP